MGEYAPLLFGGAQAGASLLGAGAQRDEAASAAAAASYNARMAERAGYEEEAAIRKSGVRLLASRRVSSAKSGVAHEGTALDAAIADAYEVEKDALYARRAGLETGRLDRRAARSATSAGRMASLGTILSGAGQAGALYYGLSRPRLSGY